MKTRKLNIKNTGVYRYLLKKDTLFATILVFLVIGGFARIEKVLGILDPKDITSKDFNYSDLAYNLLGKRNATLLDTGIVIVNIGTAGRNKIDSVIQKIASYQPKVIGVDVLFGKAKPDSLRADDALKNIFQKNPLVVTSYALDLNLNPTGYFYKNTINRGYVNFTLENQNVVREFTPFVDEAPGFTSFDATVVKKVDPGCFDTLKSMHHSTQVINYEYTETGYTIYSANYILRDSVKKEDITGKIVLLGYVSPLNDISDKHYTPLNSGFVSKSPPDLNGVFIHANIIRMILSKKYIHRAPGWVNWLIAFVLCWVHMAFFISYFIEKHIWFYLSAKMAQLISAIFFIYFGLFLFYNFNVDIDMTKAIFAIVLAVDVLYFYEAGVIWLHHKKGYKTLFHHELQH
jgi:CHASE2 domain-containing sensor protein